jgi:hypothetical protein
MKNPWVKTLLLILFVFILWVVLILGYSILNPANQPGTDHFSQTALIISIGIVLVFAVVSGYIRFFNHVATMRTQCERAKQQIESEKAEMEEFLKRMKAFFYFYVSESAKQSSSKALFETFCDVNFNSIRSQFLLSELIKAVASDQSMRSNTEFRQMMERITAKEESITAAKKSYNAAAGEYNALISRFPAILFQANMGLTPFDYYYENNAII